MKLSEIKIGKAFEVNGKVFIKIDDYKVLFVKGEQSCIAYLDSSTDVTPISLLVTL